MKQKIIQALLFAVIIIFLGAAFAHAQTPQQRAPRAKWTKHWKSPVRAYLILKRYKDNLQLTDDQLARLKEISFSLEEKILALRQQNEKLFLEMKKLIDSETPDYTAIEENVKKRAANRAVIIVESLKAREEVNAVLTEDQLKKIKAAKTAWLMRMRRMGR